MRKMLSERDHNQEIKERQKEAIEEFKRKQREREEERLIQEIAYTENFQELSRYHRRFKKEDYKNPTLAKLIKMKFWEFTAFLTQRQYFKKLPEKTQEDYERYIYSKHDIYFFRAEWEYQVENETRKSIAYIPFCLKCFCFNEYYLAGIPKCSPKWKTLITKDFTYRPKVIQIMQWFYSDFLTKNIKCMNEKCGNPIHIDYIYRELLSKLININRYSYFLEMGMKPTFLCCTCIDKFENDQLNLHIIEEFSLTDIVGFLERSVEAEEKKRLAQLELIANVPVTVLYNNEAIIRVYWYYNTMEYNEFERMIINLIEFQLNFFEKFGKINPITSNEENLFICGYSKENPPYPECCTYPESCQLELKKEVRENEI